IVPVAAGVGDNNICGGIVHVYWNTTLGRCLDFDDLVRQSALKIVEVVNCDTSRSCSSYYMCSLFDCPQDRSSRGQPKAGHHLLMNVHEKYSWGLARKGFF
ncbi:hypothetical protein AALP_AAs42412U000100, partial [Arabis alpina]